MKKFALFVITCFAIQLISTNVMAQLPDVKVKKMDGSQVNIADYAKNGKITVLKQDVQLLSLKSHICRWETNSSSTIAPNNEKKLRQRASSIAF